MSFISSVSGRLGSVAFFSLLSVLIELAAPQLTPSEGADFVIHVSVDGLRPDFMQTIIDAGNAPNLKRFQTEGAWTNNARTDYTHTITLPNHTSMLTGRPVSQPVGMPNTTHHGYTSNVDPLPTATLHNTGNLNIPYKASAFDVAHDAGLSTALYASKNKFIIYEQSYNAVTGAEHANGRDKIDSFFGPESTATMQAQLLTDLAANDFNYTFVHYADTDDAGHSFGWGSTNWNNALITVDGYLGQLFELVETDAELAGRTTIILSADHGGTGTGHSTATMAANYTIPFFVWGTGVDQGDLYTINNATRTNPGTSRPDYGASGQPIRNGDGGNLALTLLGLGPIPGSLINASQNLLVAVPQPGDFDEDGDVDGGDFLLWQRNPAVGNLVDWQNSYDNGTLSALNSVVPEPATTALIHFVVFCLVSRVTYSRC
ncbi:MAG: alkaline phosphatase family protein [Bythopirellula sp.]|nr:alkaline phosphatase family protein [Bythopirellula sp.]